MDRTPECGANVRLLEQFGLTLSVVERGFPEGDLRWGRSIWLGDVNGAEWLHEEVEERALAARAVSFKVASRRHSTHTGASAEVAEVVLSLFGGGLAQEAIHQLVEYAKHEARKRRSAKAGVPDFSEYPQRSVIEAMKWKLAELAGVSPDRFHLESEEQETSVVRKARYRDQETGDLYEVEIDRQEATFIRRNPSDST